MPSSRYVLTRTGQALLTFFLVISFTFVMIRFMPGGPQDYFMAQYMGQIDPDRLQVLMKSYTNLRPDAPLHVQYVDYITSVLQGDFGKSIWYQDSVISIIGQAMPWTVFISAASMCITFTIGIGFGAMMAYKEGGRFDTGSSIFWIVVESLPYYVFAIVMLWFLAYTTNYFPSSGKYSPDAAAGFNPEFVLSLLYHGFLPILSLVVVGIGGVALSMRGNAIQVLGEDYLRVARLRGLSEGRISMRYVARNAILPMYTSMMISIGALFGGAVILETMFNYIGVGYYMFQAVSSRDYPLMMGSFLFITLGVVVGVYIADLTYGLIDPRVEESGTRESYVNVGASPLRRLVRWLKGVARKPSTLLIIGGSVGSSADRETSVDEDSPFATVSDVQLSRRDRYRSKLDESVLAPLRIVWQDWRARFGALIILLYVFAGTVGVMVMDPPRIMEGGVLMRPFQSMEFPLGTSSQGMGLLGQTVHSTPAMLKMMTGGAVFATGMATVWGLVSGYAGGTLDRTMMTVSDVLMTIPGLPLVIVITTIFQPEGPFVVGVMLTINAWAGFSRALRSQVLTLRQESYVEASRTMDLSLGYILYRDVLPNLMPLIVVNFVTTARRVIVSSVALYFLGILPYTTLNWGVMLNNAYGSSVWYNMEYIHWILVPICTIVLMSLGLILFGQGCDRIFNPRIRARHLKNTPDDVEEVEA